MIDSWERLISKDCYLTYKAFCDENGYSNPLLNKSFGMKIKRFVDINKKRSGSSAVRYYHFNDFGKQRYEEILAEREAMAEDQFTEIHQV